MRKILGKAYRFIREIYRVNYFATIFVNFAFLPFFKAIHFPIFCYGKMRFHYTRGKIIIDGRVTPGMIKIGYRWHDLWPISYLPTQINILGTLKFTGSSIISGGVSLNIQREKAYLELGNNVLVGGGSVLKSMDCICIGNCTRITGGCIIMDSNMHYVKNIDTGVILPYNGTISIGNNCWINYGCVVAKGAIIPDYTIMARNCFVGKDYSEFGSNLFLAGSPAKVKGNNVQRILDSARQSEITRFFNMHPDAKFFQDSIGLKDETEPFEIEDSSNNQKN